MRDKHQCGCCLELGEFCRITSLSHKERLFQSDKYIPQLSVQQQYLHRNKAEFLTAAQSPCMYNCNVGQCTCSSWRILSSPGAHSWAQPYHSALPQPYHLLLEQFQNVTSQVYARTPWLVSPLSPWPPEAGTWKMRQEKTNWLDADWGTRCGTRRASSGGKFLWSRTSGRQHIHKREILLIELKKSLPSTAFDHLTQNLGRLLPSLGLSGRCSGKEEGLTWLPEKVMFELLEELTGKSKKTLREAGVKHWL